MVNNNTPPQSPRTELLDEDGNEMIYIGDLDDIEDIGEEFLEDDPELQDDDDERETYDQDEFEETIPEQDDAIQTFKKHTGPVFCGSLHPTQNLAVTGGEDDCAYVWNTETVEVVYKVEGHRDSVVATSFSYDGNYLATGDMAGEIQVFKITSDYRKVFEFSMGDMCWMKWHPKTNVLIAGGETGEIYIWRIPAGDCKVIQGNGTKCECGTLTADGKKIAVGYGDGTVKLYDIKSQAAEIEVLADSTLGHTGSVTSISTDDENGLFITSSEDGKVLIIGPSGPVGNLFPNAGPVEIVSFCPDFELKLAATGTLEGKVTIWDVPKQSVRCECDLGHPIGVTRTLWAPEQTLVVGTLSGMIKGFDARSGQEKFMMSGHVAEIYDLDFNKTTGIVLSTSEDRTAKIFRLP